MDKSFRPGVKDIQFPMAPSLLVQKSLKKHYILVGRDDSQVRFVSDFLGVVCEDLDNVKDEDLLGQTGRKLLRVESARLIDLSNDVLSSTGIYALEPVIEGSSGANAIVRYATGLLGHPCTKEIQRLVSKAMLVEKTDDIGVLIWQAVWVLTGPLPEETKRWPYPWENLRGWLPTEVDPAYRLNSLYKDLIGHVFAKKGETETVIKKLNISPARLKELQKLTLDLKKVERTLQELSRWRNQHYDPYVCALRVTRVWEPQ